MQCQSGVVAAGKAGACAPLLHGRTHLPRGPPTPPALSQQISRLLAQSFAGFEDLYDDDAPQPSPAAVLQYQLKLLAALQWRASTLGRGLVTISATDARTGELAGAANVTPGLGLAEAAEHVELEPGQVAATVSNMWAGGGATGLGGLKGRTGLHRCCCEAPSLQLRGACGLLTTWHCTSPGLTSPAPRPPPPRAEQGGGGQAPAPRPGAPDAGCLRARCLGVQPARHPDGAGCVQVQ